MKKTYLKKAIDFSSIGYALCKVLDDENKEIIDFVYTKTNSIYDNLLGLQKSEIIKKRVSEVLARSNAILDFHQLLDFSNQLAQNDGEKELELTFNNSNKKYVMGIFSPKKNYFITLIRPDTNINLLNLDNPNNYQMIVNSMNDVIWVINSEMEFSYFSPSLYHVLGYKPVEMIGKKIIDCLPESICELIKKSFEEQEMGVRKKCETVIEFEYNRKDGTPLIIENAIHNLYDNDDCFMGIMGVGRDITKWVEIKDNIDKRKQEIQLILNSTVEGIFGVNLKGDFKFCNASCLKLLGYKTEEEILHQNVSLIFGEDYDYQPLFIFDKNVNNQNIITYRKDGTSFNAEYFVYPQYSDNDIIGFVVTFFDITKRMKVENELRESERSKSVLLSNLPGMAYRCKYDPEWTMLFVSDGCFDLTGYKRDSILYNREISFNDVIAPEYREYLWKRWAEVAKVKGKLREEYQIICADGSKKWVLEQGQVIFNENDEIVAIEGLIIDINAQKQKQAEIEFLSHHDNLTGLYNRIYFDKYKQFLDKDDNFPISLIISDINGLKLINGALGHRAGDRILIETANLLLNCHEGIGIVARTGGDEFAWLLPKTSSEEAYRIMKKIQNRIEEYNKNITNSLDKINLAIGFATRENANDDYAKVRMIAEDHMYKRKLLDHNSSHSAIISSIKTTMFEKSQETEAHAERLRELSYMIGIKLNLTQVQLDELALLSTLHDIGKVGIDNQILSKPGKLTAEEWVEMKRHPEIGYRIAMASPELMSIAEGILCHHERWDGTGYPQGLKGNSIPLLSRIISIVDAFDAMTEERSYRKAISKEKALKEIKANAGTQFDPMIAELFIELMNSEEYD